MNYLWISYQPLSGSVKGSCPPTPSLIQYFAISQFFIVNCFVWKLLKAVPVTTGSPSSKYASASASNRHCCVTFEVEGFVWGKSPIVSVTYENERISIKTAYLTYNGPLHLSCVVPGPIYGRFTGCTVNGFLSMYKIAQARNMSIGEQSALLP